MKIEIFQSDKGDCLLLTSEKGATILADGGMKDSFRLHVAPALAKLAAINLVYVSHIDEDHIAGILELLDNALAWRIYEYQSKAKNPAARKPKVPKPPKIERIWHNAFGDQLGTLADGSPRVTSMVPMLSYVADILGAAESEMDDRDAPQGFHAGLVQSVKQAIQVNYRISDGQLGIKLNQGQPLLAAHTAPKPIRLKDLRIDVLCPTRAELSKLHADWDAWLAKSKAVIEDLQEKARRDAERLTSDFDRLKSFLALAKNQLGDREKVTQPNLASLVLLVRSGKKSVLLTGDAHWHDILKGLEARKLVDKNGALHLDVLKVQHHGSEHNIEEKFTQRVSADHYVFCGNGKHQNPDIDVVKLLLDSRLKTKSKAFAAAAPDRAFTFWFNSSAAVLPAGSDHRAHMQRLEKLMNAAQGTANGRLKVRFLTKGTSVTLGL